VATEKVVTRSEEGLHVVRTWRPDRVVRIRKSIVTEERTVTVLVRREELTVETSPRVSPPASASDDTGPPWTEGGQVFTLWEEEVIVDTRLVPYERVRIWVDRETAERRVDTTRRREEVVVDHLSPPVG
jgi:uncharacterized protein (TIGR02271 family)